MILRKPYAILIKYFKTIHIVMCVLFVYLVFAIRKIYMFFSNYIKTSTFVYSENMVNKYVPWLLIIIVLVLLALSISIFLLMHKKEKPVLFYRIMIIYCLLLIAMFIFFRVFFKSLDNTVYEPLRIVVNRDISLFAYIFNFFFVIFAFIRGFGFDIKKFSFDKDKRELNIEESDSEEYELNVNIEKADVKSFINKQKRELAYYFKVNKKFFITITIIIVLSLGSYFYYDYFVVNKIYHEHDIVTVGAYQYRVNSSVISEMDKYGKNIGFDNDYLVINMTIGLRKGSKELDGQALRVHIDDEYYYPVSSACSMFSDMGTCYNNKVLEAGKFNDYIFVYKIKKDYKKIYLEILKSKGDEYQYSKVELAYVIEKPTDVMSNLNDSIVLDDKDISVKSFAFYDKTSYEYEECVNNNCSKYTKRVVPNVGECVLSLEIEGSNELSDDLLNSAFGLKENDKIYTGKDIKFITRNGDNLYYSVPMNFKTSSNLYLLVTTRDTIYNVILKEVNDE